MKVSLTKAGERATSACSCRCVSVQRCSVQYKGYNLVGITTVEEGTTIGMTALVYWQLHCSLYSSAVQGYWSTPDWSDRRQRRRQVSTIDIFGRCKTTSNIVNLKKHWNLVLTFARNRIRLGIKPEMYASNGITNESFLFIKEHLHKYMSQSSSVTFPLLDLNLKKINLKVTTVG
jgi:hypothetical protein